MHTNNIIANGNLEDYKRKWTDYRKNIEIMESRAIR